MKCWNCCGFLVLSVVLCFQTCTESSSAGSIILRISNTSDTISVTWEKPDKSKSDPCYRTDLQYRHHCDTSWKSVKDIEGFSFKLPAPDMKKNYAFRIRSRLNCIDGNWSNWSPEKHWKNVTGDCFAETPVSIRNYLLVTLLPLTCLLFICVVTQERVRRHVLPIIPDPKHSQERILNIEQFQWFTSFSETNEECEIVEIEVDCERRDDQKPEITDQQPLPKHTDAVPESCDLGLTTNTSMYCTHSPDSPQVTVVPQCSHTMPGYIVI